MWQTANTNMNSKHGSTVRKVSSPSSLPHPVFSLSPYITPCSLSPYLVPASPCVLSLSLPRPCLTLCSLSTSSPGLQDELSQAQAQSELAPYVPPCHPDATSPDQVYLFDDCILSLLSGHV